MFEFQNVLQSGYIYSRASLGSCWITVEEVDASKLKADGIKKPGSKTLFIVRINGFGKWKNTHARTQDDAHYATLEEAQKAGIAEAARTARLILNLPQ